MNYFIQAMQLYAVFHGRATRTEYWMFTLIYIVIYACCAVIAIAFESEVLLSLLTIALLLPSISITTRRLHDTDRTGWWQLIYFIPILGFIVMIVFLTQKSDNDNQYGDAPNFEHLEASPLSPPAQDSSEHKKE